MVVVDARRGRCAVGWEGRHVRVGARAEEPAAAAEGVEWRHRHRPAAEREERETERLSGHTSDTRDPTTSGSEMRDCTRQYAAAPPRAGHSGTTENSRRLGRRAPTRRIRTQHVPSSSRGGRARWACALFPSQPQTGSRLGLAADESRARTRGKSDGKKEEGAQSNSEIDGAHTGIVILDVP